MSSVVIIGCPYGALKGLTLSLKGMTGDETKIISVEDIGSVSDKEITLETGKIYRYDQVRSSHIRYPYDLIPPHTSTFVKREKTEFLKSIALLLSPVSVNDVGNAWRMRNRLFSLHRARAHGLRTPKSLLSRDFIDRKRLRERLDDSESGVATKAIGNCYVASQDASVSKSLRSFVTLAEDDGESAYIFPASLLSESDVIEYLDAVNCTFVQEAIRPAVEYRCYLVAESVFVYEREKTDSFDQSAATYHATDYSLGQNTREGIKELMIAMDFQYICFDVLVTNTGSEVVIDINPFGSLPPHDRFPVPTKRLASLLLNPPDDMVDGKS